jgi:hypothetical protein
MRSQFVAANDAVEKESKCDDYGYCWLFQILVSTSWIRFYLLCFREVLYLPLLSLL